jgi:hypothetical protein
MLATATSERFEIGRVFSRMFSVIGKNFFTFFVLATLLSIPQLAITVFGLFAHPAGLYLHQSFGVSGGIAAAIGGALLGLLIYFVCLNLLQAAIVRGTIVTLNDGRASIGDCLATGLSNALPLTAIAFLTGLGCALGLILFVIPGVILALAWSVVAPVRVAEGTSIFATLGRSAELTRGYRGSIFLLFLVVGITVGVLQLIVRPIVGISLVASAGSIGAAGSAVFIPYIILTALIQIFTSLIGATNAASMYYELRMVKEGIGPERLASVFD